MSAICNIYIHAMHLYMYVHIYTHVDTCVYVCIYAHISAWTIQVITKKVAVYLRVFLP